MATKKQKRLAGLAKREQWLADQKASGLQAQKKDHENRKNRKRDEQREKHDKEHSWKVIEKNCILCLDRLEDARRSEKFRSEVSNG